MGWLIYDYEPKTHLLFISTHGLILYISLLSGKNL